MYYHLNNCLQIIIIIIKAIICSPNIKLQMH